MAKCPSCHQNVNHADRQTGKCPHCGARLPLLSETAMPPQLGPVETQAPVSHDASRQAFNPEMTTPLPATPVSSEVDESADLPFGTGTEAALPLTERAFIVPVAAHGGSDDPGTAMPPPAVRDDTSFDPNRTVNPREDAGKSIDASKTIIDDSLTIVPDATIAGGAFNASVTSPMDATIPPETPSSASQSKSQQKKSGVALEDSLVIQPRAVRRSTSEIVSCDYNVSKLIGEGGMGLVYQARQASLDREVALKMIKPRALDESARARYKATELERVEQTLQRRDREWFLTEAMVTANLEHPYIVPVYDVIKDQQNSLFYAMKWVRGIPWSKSIRDKTEAENLEVLMKVADAVAFAHDKGVIHRDIKPENVMVGAHGEVYVMDWGAALATPDFERATTLSQSSSGFGSPLYAAPELFLGTVEQIGVRSDVYLLGAVLFEIISGNPPHPYPTSRSEVLSILRTNEIRPTDYKGELLDISLRAMAARPDQRYANVQEFQLAIREYQQHANSRTLSKRARSNLVKADQTGDYADYQRAVFAYDEAYALWHGNEEAHVGVGQARLAYAGAALRKGDFDLGLEVADAKDASHRDVIVSLRAAQTERDSRQKRLKTMRRAIGAMAALILIGAGVAMFLINEQKRNAVIARDEAREAQHAEKLAKDDAVKQKGIAEQNLVLAEKNEAEAKRQKGIAEENEVEAVKQKGIAETNEKQAIANAAEAKKQQGIAEENAQRAIAAKAAQEYEAYIAEIGLADSKIKTSAFEDVRRVLSGIRGDEQRRREAAAPQAPVRSLRGWEFNRLEYLAGQAVTLLDGNKEAGARDRRVEALAVDVEGKRFIAGRLDGTVVIGPTAADENAPRVEFETGRPVRAVAFSSDGKLIAVAGDPGKAGSVQLWSDAGNPVGKPFGGASKTIYSVQFGQRQGKTWLLTGGADGSAQVWAVGDGQPRPVGSPLVGHYGAVRRAIFSPDGELIVTVGDDFRAVVWGPGEGSDEAPFEMKRAVRFHDSPVLAAAWSTDGKKVASSDEDGRLIVWNPAVLAVKVKAVNPAAGFNGQKEAKIDRGEAAILYGNLAGHDKAVRSIAFSDDGNYLLSGGDDNAVKLQRLPAKDPAAKSEDVRTFHGHGGQVHACLLVSLGDQALAERQGLQNWFVLSGAHDSTVMRWNVAAYKEEQVFRDPVLAGTTGPDRDVLSAAFSPDGDSVITGSRDHKAYQWNVRTGKKLDFDLAPSVRRLDEGHSLPIWTAAYAPDGAWFMTAGMDDTSLLWSTATGTQWARLPRTGIPAVIAVSPDGNWIATSASESFRATAGRPTPRVQFWNVGDLRAGTPAAGRRAAVHSVERQGQLTALAFAPGSAPRLYSGFECKDPTNTPGGGLVWELRQKNGYVQWEIIAELPATTQINSAAFYPGGQKLLTARDDGNVALVDLSGPKPESVAVLEHGPPVRFVGLHPDGDSALTVTADTKSAAAPAQKSSGDTAYFIHRWDLASARSRNDKAIRIETPNFFSLAVAPRGDEAVVVAAAPVGQPGTVVRRYNLDTGVEITRQGNRPYLESRRDARQYWGAVYAPQPQVGGENQILALHGARAELYDQAARLVSRSNPHGQVRAVGYSSDAKFVLTAGADGTIKVWDAQTGLARCKIVNPHGDAPLSIESAMFSPVEKSYQILSCGRDKSARLWNWDGKSDALTLARQWKHDSEIRSAAFSSDGRRIVCGCEDGTAWIWRIDDDKQPLGKTSPWDPARATDGGHQGPVLAVVFSKTSSDWIVTGGEDNLAYVWSVGNAITMHSVLKGHAAAVRCAAFSPDDRRVVTGSGDTYAKLWDPRLPGNEAPAAGNDRNARELLTLSRHERAVTTVAFSPGNGETVLTASSDGDTVLWLSKSGPVAKE